MKKYTSIKGLLEMISEGKQPEKFWFTDNPKQIFAWDKVAGEYWAPKSGSPSRLLMSVGKATASNRKTICFDQPVLDDVEKRYLQSIIQPFRKNVKGITKKVYMDYCEGKPYECIEIDLNTQLMGIPTSHDCIELPLFKEGTMYTGMTRYKMYSLKELEI